VDHVSNVNDIDDKIIGRANEEHRRPEEIAERYEAEWWEAMSTLGCLLPTQVPHATASSRRWWRSLPSSWRSLAYETSDGVLFRGLGGRRLRAARPPEPCLAAVGGAR